MTVGWTGAELMRRIGGEPTHFGPLLAQDVVEARTAVKVRALYEQFWNVPPPVGTRVQRTNVSKARNFASRRGFLPPMAWDDDTIDDPAAQPDMGEPASRGLDLAEVAHLRAGGCSDEEIARRMGVSAGAIERARFRAAREERVS